MLTGESGSGGDEISDSPTITCNRSTPGEAQHHGVGRHATKPAGGACGFQKHRAGRGNGVTAARYIQQVLEPAVVPHIRRTILVDNVVEFYAEELLSANLFPKNCSFPKQTSQRTSFNRSASVQKMRRRTFSKHFHSSVNVLYNLGAQLLVRT